MGMDMGLRLLRLVDTKVHTTLVSTTREPPQLQLAAKMYHYKIIGRGSPMMCTEFPQMYFTSRLSASAFVPIGGCVMGDQPVPDT